MSSRPDLAEHAARMAGIAAGVARRYFRGRLGVAFKADDSPVTEADRAVETEIRAYLAAHFPDHGVFGEEHGSAGIERENLWVIDPIDGTRSFLSGYPTFGFLLAHLQGGVPVLGVVGMPALDELFIGVAGQGATLNGAPVSVSGQTALDRAILYINEGERLYRDAPGVLARLLQAGQTRRLAHDCYPHALLAAGHVDAVVDYGLEPYDYLAVSALVGAAGGVMSDWDGKPLDLNSDGRVVAAATPALHAALLARIKG